MDTTEQFERRACCGGRAALRCHGAEESRGCPAVPAGSSFTVLCACCALRQAASCPAYLRPGPCLASGGAKRVPVGHQGRALETSYDPEVLYGLKQWAKPFDMHGQAAALHCTAHSPVVVCRCMSGPVSHAQAAGGAATRRQGASADTPRGEGRSDAAARDLGARRGRHTAEPVRHTRRSRRGCARRRTRAGASCSGGARAAWTRGCARTCCTTASRPCRRPSCAARRAAGHITAGGTGRHTRPALT